jgi:four helix bundle protein
MLAIYDVMLDVLRGLRPVIREIEKYDSDLVRQMRRAGSSVVLNLAEGSGSFGGIRRARYRTALGSAKETKAGLDAADALGYVTASLELKDKLGHVIATLTKVAR